MSCAEVDAYILLSFFFLLGCSLQCTGGVFVFLLCHQFNIIPFTKNYISEKSSGSLETLASEYSTRVRSSSRPSEPAAFICCTWMCTYCWSGYHY
jgi:hypothetical protein